MIKVIAFDCWSTLFYKNINPSPFEHFSNKLGYSMRDYEYLKIFEECFMLENNSNYKKPINNILKRLNIKKTLKEKKELIDILNNNTLPSTPFDEVFEVLDKLIKKKYTLAIISNAEPIGFNSLMLEYNLDKYFTHIIKSCDVGSLKPNPEIFEQLIKSTKVKKDEILMVGDSMQDDVLGAEKFGIKGVLIDRKDMSNYKNRINSLKEINKYL